MSSLGFARFAALFIIAVLGLAGQVAVAPVGLPELPADALAHGWERFYSPVREVGFLALFLAAIVIGLQQYKDGVTPGTLLLTPFAVVFYLMLPDFFPAGLGPGIVVLLMLGALFAIVAAVLVDMQPEERRPAGVPYGVGLHPCPGHVPGFAHDGRRDSGVAAWKQRARHPLGD